MDPNQPPATNQPPAEAGAAATVSPPATPGPAGPTKPVSARPRFDLTNLREKFNSAPKNTKLLIVVTAVFLFLILLLAIATLIKGSPRNQGIKPTPTPAPVSGSPIPKYEITNPSVYATDSAVLKIESDIDNLGREMDAIDLRTNELRIPVLDMDVKF